MDEKKVPNPDGKLGGKEHRKKVKEVSQEVKKKGLIVVFEKLIRLFKNKKRFVDIAGLNEQEKVIEIHQIGKQNRNSMPVKRERVVMDELEQHTGIKPIFHAYNKIEEEKQ